MRLFFFQKKSSALLFLFAIFFAAVLLSQCRHSFREGKALYDQYCASCHLEDGQGLRSLYPPLAESDYLKNNQEKLPCIILIGLQGEIVVNGKTYDQPMPGVPTLKDWEVVLIINYINHAWGNDANYTDIREVEANLKNCE